jgi:CHAD domain-containing protein
MNRFGRLLAALASIRSAVEELRDALLTEAELRHRSISDVEGFRRGRVLARASAAEASEVERLLLELPEPSGNGDGPHE